MKKLNYYKDQVANNEGYSSFSEYATNILESLSSIKDVPQLEKLEKFMEKAAELHASDLQSENERLKADMEWISTKDNPPKDGQDVLAYQVKPDWEGNILLRWNSASFTYIEYPYYMLEPKPPKQ